MTNYIVSGLERSGTSLMMQILQESGFPVSYDHSRTPDVNNPQGYFELLKGLIINKLIDGTFDMSLYDDMAIKITSYGLQFLPEGNYKILYMYRNTAEVYASQQKMMGQDIKSSLDDVGVMNLLSKMNKEAIDYMDSREDIESLIVLHRKLVSHDRKEFKRISEFLGHDVSKGMSVVNDNLWRNRE